MPSVSLSQSLQWGCGGGGGRRGGPQSSSSPLQIHLPSFCAPFFLPQSFRQAAKQTNNVEPHCAMWSAGVEAQNTKPKLSQAQPKYPFSSLPPSHPHPLPTDMSMQDKNENDSVKSQSTFLLHSQGRPKRKTAWKRNRERDRKRQRQTETQTDWLTELYYARIKV